MAMEPAEQHATDTETAGLIVRPPLLYLGALLLGLALDRLLPLPVPAAGLPLWIAGGALVLIGLALGVAGVRNFSAAGTPVQSVKPTCALVTTGIHGWSRNPIYLGMFLIYGGIGIAAHSPWILAITLPLAIVMRYGIVAREEAYLEQRFGEPYRAYKARVRRWL